VTSDVVLAEIKRDNKIKLVRSPEILLKYFPVKNALEVVN